MLLRAVFWIGLVSLLMPHEPDLGFGRPGTSSTAGIAAVPTGSITSLIQTGGDASAAVANTCINNAAACATGLSILDGFQAFAIRSMDQVRADLAANRRQLR